MHRVGFQLINPPNVNDLCWVCHAPFGKKPIIVHVEGGETHPAHLKCMRIWVRTHDRCTDCNQLVDAQALYQPITFTEKAASCVLDLAPRYELIQLGSSALFARYFYLEYLVPSPTFDIVLLTSISTAGLVFGALKFPSLAFKIGMVKAYDKYLAIFYPERKHAVNKSEFDVHLKKLDHKGLLSHYHSKKQQTELIHQWLEEGIPSIGLSESMGTLLGLAWRVSDAWTNAS